VVDSGRLIVEAGCRSKEGEVNKEVKSVRGWAISTDRFELAKRLPSDTLGILRGGGYGKLSSMLYDDAVKILSLWWSYAAS